MQQFENLLKRDTDSDEGSQNVLKNRAIRKHKHVESALENLKTKQESNASLHEVEVLLTSVEKAVCDLELFVDSNVNVISDAAFNEDKLKKHEAVQLRYLNEAALPKAYTHEIKAEFEKDRLAGCLSVGVNVPTFDGNVLKLPTF